MDFYRFWQILEGYDSWKLATPPDWESPDWNPDDLTWSEWNEDSQSVFLVNGKFVDKNNAHLEWLDNHIQQASNLTQNHQELPKLPDNQTPSYMAGKADYKQGMWLTYEARYGQAPGGRDRRTGEEWEPQNVAIEIKNPALEKDESKVQLPENVSWKIASHFFKEYKTL